jgi:hypothetical protein
MTGNWLLIVLELIVVLLTDVSSPVPVFDTVPSFVAKLVMVAEVTCVSRPVDGVPNALDDAFNPAARLPKVRLDNWLSIRITLELLPEPRVDGCDVDIDVDFDVDIDTPADAVAGGCTPVCMGSPELGFAPWDTSSEISLLSFMKDALCTRSLELLTMF